MIGTFCSSLLTIWLASAVIAVRQILKQVILLKIPWKRLMKVGLFAICNLMKLIGIPFVKSLFPTQPVRMI
jgi:hypothetical protein